MCLAAIQDPGEKKKKETLRAAWAKVQAQGDSERPRNGKTFKDATVEAPVEDCLSRASQATKVPESDRDNEEAGTVWALAARDNRETKTM